MVIKYIVKVYTLDYIIMLLFLKTMKKKTLS